MPVAIPKKTQAIRTCAHNQLVCFTFPNVNLSSCFVPPPPHICIGNSIGQVMHMPTMQTIIIILIYRRKRKPSREERLSISMSGVFQNGMIQLNHPVGSCVARSLWHYQYADAMYTQPNLLGLQTAEETSRIVYPRAEPSPYDKHNQTYRRIHRHWYQRCKQCRKGSRIRSRRQVLDIRRR